MKIYVENAVETTCIVQNVLHRYLANLADPVNTKHDAISASTLHRSKSYAIV